MLEISLSENKKKFDIASGECASFGWKSIE
jgi:hypothetical protein